MKPPSKRNVEIYRRHEAGETFVKLGREFGICRERARQIWLRELRRNGDPRGYYGPRLAKKIRQLRMTEDDKDYAQAEEDAERKRAAKEGFPEDE
jgi:hypothetical protein